MLVYIFSSADHNGEHDPYKTSYGLAELFPDICFGHHRTRPQSPVVNEDTHPKLFDLWRGDPSHSKSSKAVEGKVNFVYIFIIFTFISAFCSHFCNKFFLLILYEKNCIATEHST